MALLFGFALAASELEETTAIVQVTVVDSEGLPAAIPETAALEATAADDSARKLTLPFTTNPLELRLPVARSWRLCVVAEALWSPCEIVTPSAAPADPGQQPVVVAARLRSWPSARISGRLRIADDEQVPVEVLDRLKVTVGPPPGPRPPNGFADSVVPCTTDHGGRFTCEVPAIPLYAAVRSSGYVSRYFWDVVPPSGGTVDLGEVVLRSGASLSGSVDLSLEGIAADHLSIRLVPALSPSTDPAVAGAARKDTLVETVSTHGFFQFTGIRPGAYLLEVSHPGFATSRPGPFEVYEGKETALRRAIVLERPITVDVTIDPPLSPLGSRWFLRAFRAREWSAGSEPIFTGEVPDDGYLFLLGQSPGLFSLSISDREGNRFSTSTVRVDRENPAIHVEVPILRIRGRLLLGGEPLAGTLIFGGRDGERRSRMISDDEGEFAGVLADGGSWRVEIHSEDPPLETETRIEIDAGSDGEASVEIDLPDTELVGRVVDMAGTPVPEATVRVEAGKFVSVTDTTDREGRFHVRAAPEGRATVAAWATLEGARATSDPVEITLSEEELSAPVDLVLRPVHGIRGRVHSATGPVAGARVFAVTVGLPVPWNASAVSGVDGGFTLELPVDDGLLATTLLTPGGFLTTAIRAIEEPLELRTAEAGGDLVVELPESDAAAPPLVALEREGVYVSHGLLMEWSAGHGLRLDPRAAAFEVPRLAEGRYRACIIDPIDRSRARERGKSLLDVVAGATRCAEGTLSPGGVLVLRIEDANEVGSGSDEPLPRIP